MSKLIERCAECAYYRSGGRCLRGAKQETNPQAPFYDDCPLPDAGLVSSGWWVKIKESETKGYIVVECSECKIQRTIPNVRMHGYYYCPNCGADMRGG